MWKKVAVQEANGSFDKNFPLSLDLTAIPGRGVQPAFCCSISSGKGHVVGFDVNKKFGAIAEGHHNCNHGSCPACYKHWLLSETLYAIAYLEAVKAAHPGSDVYQLRYTFQKQESVTRNDIDAVFDALNNHYRKAEGIYGGVNVLHNFQVKKCVGDEVNSCYESYYEDSLTRTKMYWAATDLDFLHHAGFTNFRDWREAVDPFWHIHSFVVADHYPVELYLHGNMKNSAAKFLSGGPVKGIPHNITDNKSKNTDLLRPNGSSRRWVEVRIKDHTCPYEGADLARSLYYAFSHCTLSATPTLEFKAFRRFGECYKLQKLDFKHDQPWTEEEFRLDLTTGEEILTTVQKYPDSRVELAYGILQLAYPHIHRRGEFVYPGHEKAPKFNEALPRKTPYVPLLTRINARIFQLRTVYRNGIRVPADGSQFVYKRRDAFVDMVRFLENEGIIPIFPIRLSTSIKKAFEAWDKRCLDPRLRAKDRLLYTSDFEGYEDFKKAGWVTSLGFISKAMAYKPPESTDFEKFRALRVGFNHACWNSDWDHWNTDTQEGFFKILCYSLEPVAGLGAWESSNNPDAELELIRSAMKKAGVFSKKAKKRSNHSDLGRGFTKVYDDSTLQDCDFDSVTKLSWITEQEDLAYEEEDY